MTQNSNENNNRNCKENMIQENDHFKNDGYYKRI